MLGLGQSATSLSRGASYRRPGARAGAGGAVGNGKSLFQTSSTMSQRPFCCAQRTMYLPESTAAMPGGNFAPAGKAQCHPPGFTGTRPLPTTVTARRERGGGRAHVIILHKKPRNAALSFLRGQFRG